MDLHEWLTPGNTTRTPRGAEGSPRELPSLPLFTSRPPRDARELCGDTPLPHIRNKTASQAFGQTGPRPRQRRHNRRRRPPYILASTMRLPWLYFAIFFCCFPCPMVCDHIYISYLSRMKNQDGHWVYCWCRGYRKNGSKCIQRHNTYHCTTYLVPISNCAHLVLVYQLKNVGCRFIYFLCTPEQCRTDCINSTYSSVGPRMSLM